MRDKTNSLILELAKRKYLILRSLDKFARDVSAFAAIATGSLTNLTFSDQRTARQRAC